MPARTRIRDSALAHWNTPSFETLRKIAGPLPGRLGFIGGVVRDWVLENQTVDIDLIWDGDFSDLSYALEQSELPVRIRPDYLTANCVINHQHFDLSATRTDRYPVAGGIPHIVAAGLEMDLARRDFTANAIAVFVDHSEIRIVDSFNGLSDISKKLLKPVAPQTLSEDPVRILRGARYLCRLQFKVAGDWQESLHHLKNKSAWSGVAIGRIWREFQTVADETAAIDIYQRLNEWNVWPALFGCHLTEKTIEHLMTWRSNHPLENRGTGRNWLIDLRVIQLNSPDATQYIAKNWKLRSNELNRWQKLSKPSHLPNEHWANKAVAGDLQ